MESRTYNEAYHRYLLTFMSFRTGLQYEKRHVFPKSELRTITDVDVVRFFRFSMFGVTEEEQVTPDTEWKLRVATVEFAKKAISWYMPRRNVDWDEENGTGNPTKSDAVRTFIQFIKQGECRKLGKPSNAKDPLTMAMFRCALRILELDQNDYQRYYRYTAMCKFQFHLITRADDMGNFKIRDLQSHANPMYSSFALQTTVYWSKNVYEERDCPDQIILGSHDPDFCILLSLGLYLESWFSAGNGSRCTLLFADSPGSSKAIVERLKERYRNHLTDYVFSHPSFKEVVAEGKEKNVGTHSYRKFACSYAFNNGMSKENIEVRGRWKRNGSRVVDRYIDVEQQWIDAKVASVLCVGGPVRYVVSADCGVTKHWLLENVVPGIASIYTQDGNNIAEVLGVVVLWACFDPVTMTKVPGWLLNRVRTAYERTMELPPGGNPVEKRKLFIFPMGGQLCIQDAATEGSIGAATVPALAGGVSNDNVQTQIFQMLTQINQQITDMGGRIDNVIADMSVHQQQFERKLIMVNKNINRFIRQPAFPIRRINNNNNNIINNNNNNNNNDNNNNNNDNNNNNNNNDNFIINVVQPEMHVVGEADGGWEVGLQPPVSKVELSKGPKSLHDLWREYTHGQSGNKPARDFTPCERGANKSLYCRRKVFWDCVDEHLKRGYSLDATIARIYAAYGNLAVTPILLAMVKDKQRGGHPNLRF